VMICDDFFLNFVMRKLVYDFFRFCDDQPVYDFFLIL
jgi:hypothetical protein